jgi:folylpolyglutamate synthase/dihydropteroate synthase
MNLCRNELRHLGRAADADCLQSRETPAAAWELAQRWAAPDELACITGSFFIAAEMRGLATAAAVAERPA